MTVVEVEHDGIIALAVLTAVACGVGAVVWFAPATRRKRLLRAAPLVPVCDLTPGLLAKVEGTVVLDEGVESLLGEERCAYWRLEVSYRERSRPGDGMHWYRSIAREERREFWLRDGTGAVRISVEGAQFRLVPRVLRPTEHEDPTLSDRVARFLSNAGVPLQTDEGEPRTFGFDERALAEGATITVIGRVEATSDGRRIVGTSRLPVWVEEDPPW